MNILRRLFRRYAPPADEPFVADEDLSKADRVNDLFYRDFYQVDVLPRGTISDIAREAGCSQGYVSRLAKAHGYSVGKANG